MGGGPIDAPATIAHRKSLLARIDKWRHALPYCFRTYLSELKVASRASGQSTTAWVDRKPLEHFAKLSAKIIRAEVDYIGCCAEPLVAGEHYALLAPSRAQKLGTAKFGLEADVSTAESEPSRDAREHSIRCEAGEWRVLLQLPSDYIACRARRAVSTWTFIPIRLNINAGERFMAYEPVKLAGSKILVSGATGMVARPIVAEFAKRATVYALARYGRSDDRRAIEELGAKTIAADLADRATLSAIPDDIDYVVNCAVLRSNHIDQDYAVNADGVGYLMARCRGAKAFLQMSTTGVYESKGHEPRKECDPLGDSHHSMFPTYSISKIAGERVCMFAARQFGIPTTIARLCVPYGEFGGWPFFHLMMMKAGAPIELHPERPNYYNLLHIDDCIEKIPRLLAAASDEVTLTNFAAAPRVSIEQWCGYLGELTGVTPRFVENPGALGSLCTDLTRMHSLVGETRVGWHEGLRQMVEARAPEMLR